MGIMRFKIPRDSLETWPQLNQGYLGSIDGRVFPTELLISDDELICKRHSSESARFFVPCPVTGFGIPVLSTGSLREQAEPHLLLIELARGRLGIIRDQVAAWEQAGMQVPESVFMELRASQQSFLRSVCGDEDADLVSSMARSALVHACGAADNLMQAYVQQRLSTRRRRSSHLPVLLSCPLGEMRPSGSLEKSFSEAFTAATISIQWPLVEATQGQHDWTLQDEQLAATERTRLIPLAGPLIDFREEGLPPWLCKWNHDYYALQSFVSDFVETAVLRYSGRIRIWEIVARGNTGFGAQFDEEHRLALTARSIEVAKQVDDELQILLRISQPWGEYQAAGAHRLSPLQFVDALLRSGVGLTGVVLEIAVGYTFEGTPYRDLLDVSRLIDLWANLGIPLTIALAFPSQSRRDLNADAEIGTTPAQWKTGWSEPAQAEWLGSLFPLLMAKPAVVGIEWSQFSDGIRHRFPHAGLTRSDGSAKPALERLTRFRQSYWRRSTQP